jgi:parvulin-like peptidyl-prolyl isomerase
MTDKIGASHILLMYEGSMRSTATRSRDEALTKIQSLKDELDAGGDFADLAAKSSDCPSGQQGGRLGTFGRGQMVPAFDESAFGLDIGEVSGIVETPFGYHLLYRTE